MPAIEPAIKHLVAIDKKIDRNEKAALRLRWEFGKHMLAKREGKQLPKGMLDKLVDATGKGRSELGYRMQFAEKHPTDDELSNALETFTSWREVIASFTASADGEEGTNEPTAKQQKADLGRLTGAAEKVLSDIVEGLADEARDDFRKGLVAAKDTIDKALAKLDAIDADKSKAAHPAGKGRQTAVA